MDENSSNQNAQQPAQPSTSQPQQDQASVQAPVQNPADNSATPTLPSQSENAQTQQANPSAESQTQPADYIEDVGGDMIGLLDEINENDALIQKVADEMQFDKEKVRSMLASLLNKIDQEQITEGDIALIMASTVADELTEEENKA